MCLQTQLGIYRRLWALNSDGAEQKELCCKEYKLCKMQQRRKKALVLENYLVLASRACVMHQPMCV